MGNNTQAQEILSEQGDTFTPPPEDVVNSEVHKFYEDDTYVGKVNEGSLEEQRKKYIDMEVESFFSNPTKEEKLLLDSILSDSSKFETIDITKVVEEIFPFIMERVLTKHNATVRGKIANQIPLLQWTEKTKKVALGVIADISDNRDVTIKEYPEGLVKERIKIRLSLHFN